MTFKAWWHILEISIISLINTLSTFYYKNFMISFDKCPLNMVVYLYPPLTSCKYLRVLGKFFSVFKPHFSHWKNVYNNSTQDSYELNEMQLRAWCFKWIKCPIIVHANHISYSHPLLLYTLFPLQSLPLKNHLA